MYGVHVYFSLLGRRNVLHFSTSEAEYVALNDVVKESLF